VFDPQRRLFSWTPDTQSAGTYDVEFTVSDELIETAGVVTFLIAPLNQSPTLIVPPDRTVREGEPIDFDLLASDAEGDVIRFSSTVLPGGATVDPRTGHFRWTPAFFQEGTFTIPFQVDDGNSATTRGMTITVLNVNAAPVFDALDLFQIQEGQSLSIRAFALDPDNPSFVPQDRLADGTLSELESTNPSVTYAVSNLPPGAAFDPVTTLFSWQTEFADAGLYQIGFTATDDGDGTGSPLTTLATLPIRVLNTNRPPVIAPITNQSLNRGEVVDVVVQATDDDGDPIALSAAGLPGLGIPSFASFTDNGDGTAVLHLTPGFGARGNHSITITARDDGDGGGPSAVLSAEHTFIVTVNSANESPVLAPIGRRVAVVGQPFLI
jgi:hypothetical protein